MMDRKTIITILAVIFVAVVLLIIGQDSEAQTVPAWVGTDLTAGITDILSDGTTPSTTPLSSIQVIETTNWIGTFWGRSWNGSLVRIFPVYGAGTDTTITPPVGAYFIFTGVKLEEIRTVSGTATFWGE